MDLKTELTSAFVQYVVPLLFTAIGTLGAAALTALTLKLRGDAEKAKLEGKNIAWQSLASRAAHLTQLVVQDLQVSIRPQLLAASADGVIDALELRSLRTIAIQRIVSMLKAEGINELKAFVGDLNVDKYLGSLVESVLSGIKVEEQKSAALVVAATPAPFMTPGGLPLTPPSEP